MWVVLVCASVVLRHRDVHCARWRRGFPERRQAFDDDGHLVEADPPRVLAPGEIVILQPYGSLFFAAAPVLEQLRVARVTDVIDADDLYLGDERVGVTLRRAHDDAMTWMASRP